MNPIPSSVRRGIVRLDARYREGMVRKVPHVHEDVSDVARRVTAFRRAPESERLGAIAELTQRRVSMSGTFSATVAALVIASIVGGLAAYTSYIALLAQSRATAREDAIALSNAFQERGEWGKSVDLLKLAASGTELLGDTAELIPLTLLMLVCATVLTLMWAWWRTRRGSIADAWLAVYRQEPEAEPILYERRTWRGLFTRRRHEC